MSGPIFRLADVTVPGRRTPRLDHVTVDIPPGVTAVLGASGAGKSTLLNLLVGFEQPASGSIHRKPVAPARDADGSSLASTSGSLPIFWSPPGHGLWPHVAVRGHLDASELDADRLLELLDLSPLANAYPPTLSQGERDRLSLARSWASGAEVLVLDEPLVHVPSHVAERYWGSLLPLRPEGSSIIFATHDPELVLRFAGHVICLEAGRVIYAGGVEELYNSPKSEREAWFLGPINWWDANSQAMWLPGRACEGELAVRPERLIVEPEDASPIRIERTTPLGAITETELLHGTERRTVWHRTEPPATASRVALRVLMLLCLCLLASCRPSSNQPTLAVRDVQYWSIPPEGTRIPAPRAVHAGPHDEIFVLDNAGRVLVYNRNGTIARKWWMPEYSVGKPEGIFVLIDGRIAVADTHYHRVVFFDYQGNFLGSFGSLGREPGEFIYPVKLTQDPDGYIYVGEYGDNDRIQKFTAEGKFVKQFGSFGTQPGQFQRPSGIVWRDHKLYIVDAFNNRIQVYSDEGDYEGVLNSDADALSYPYDIYLSPAGDLFIAEYGGNRVAKFSLDGKLLGRYGTGGGGPGQFSTPWSLAVDQHGRVLVADTGNRRVVVLELGR